MEDPKKKSLSEISHLFLSSVRDNATGGIRPMRIPPGGERNASQPRRLTPPRSSISIDLTPEEYARVIVENAAPEPVENPPYGPVTAVICSQFNGHQLDRTHEYARHLAATGQRIGLIHVDANEATVTCFETASSEPTAEIESQNAATPREMSQAMQELAWDVDRWLLLVSSPRQAEARELLRKADHWVLLSTCDHEGVVSCYRAIKGLAEMPRPRLTLALLNAADKNEAGKVYRKISNVCEQFLNWKMEAESAVEPTDMVSENLAVNFTAPANGTGTPGSSHWDPVLDFLTKAQAESNQPSQAAPAPMHPLDVLESEIEAAMEEKPQPVLEAPAPAAVIETPAPAMKPAPTFTPTPEIPMRNTSTAPAMAFEEETEVADLPGGEVTESAVLNAVVNRMAGGLIQCPIHPPMCPSATVAVGRDNRLVLVAVARKGLTELRSIALAYRWVIENRPLLSMALPQFAIDTHAHPQLKLIVDRSDSGADLLMPMTEHSNVTVQTYRKLRWAGKTGLLLEAA